MVLPWVGLLYTPDPQGLGIDYAEKTLYWFYGVALASISFRVFPPQRLIQAFLLGLALNALVAVVQFSGIFSPTGGEEFRGFGEGYSILSAYLIVGMFVASYYFREAKEKRAKIVPSLLMILYFFHLIIMRGRTGYVTFILLSPLIVHTLFRRLGFLKITLCCALLFAIMFFSPIVRDRIDLSIDQFRYHLNAEPDAAWGKEYNVYQDRFYMWYGAFPIFLENPFFGVGTGGYQTALKEKRKRDDPYIAHPHNNLLHMAVSFGIVGIIAYLWLFVETVRNAWEQRDTLVGFYVVSTTVVIFISGLFNTTILDVGTSFLLSVTVGLQQGFPKFAKSSDKETGEEPFLKPRPS